MKTIMIILSILLMLAGLSIMIRPAFFYDWVEGSLEAKSFYYSVVIGRFAFGLLLVFAAQHSKHSTFIKALGALAILAAVVFMLMGHDSFVGFMSTIMPVLRPYAMVSGLGSMGLGGFFLYSFMKR